MTAAQRTAVERGLVAVVTFLLGLVTQGMYYAASVREDIHDLKRDMADVRCTVAIYTRSALLPPNCTPGRYGDAAQWKEQPKSQ